MPAIGFRIARASAFAFLLVFANLTAAGIGGSHVTLVAAASTTEIAAPDQPGPFNVGVMVFSATMSGGRTTRVQVFYPTAEPVDCAMRYRIDYLAGFYELQSPLCARSNAQAFPGWFPLVVHDHGAGPRLTSASRADSLHEVMASHGFVTAVALPADPVVRVRDLTLVIDALLARNATGGDPLARSIDPARIGISGISAGAAAAIGAAGGIAASASLRTRESRRWFCMSRAWSIARRRRQDRDPVSDYGWVTVAVWPGGSALFAKPFGAASHLRAESQRDALQLCDRHVHGNRSNAGSRALADPLPEPLTNRIATNPAAARAFDAWNIGQILFGLLGPGAGSGRNFCNRVGVNSIRSLDAVPQDGFTDSPPFLSTDAFTLNPVIPEEILVPQIKLHTVAFWKTFLQGDDRYMRYLTAGYARRHHLEAEVFKID
jgi:predicted dienelactone hydrolase